MSNKSTSITLSGKQLLDALSMITGGGFQHNLTVDQLETEIDLQHMEAWKDKEDGEMSAGLYVNLSEYPEEGLYGPLGETHEANLIQLRAKA